MQTIESLTELLRMAHEQIDTELAKNAELKLKTCILDSTKGHLSQCEAALESRDELNETLKARITELEKEQSKLVKALKLIQNSPFEIEGFPSAKDQAVNMQTLATKSLSKGVKND